MKDCVETVLAHGYVSILHVPSRAEVQYNPALCSRELAMLALRRRIEQATELCESRVVE